MTDGFFGAIVHVAEARLDQVGEVEQAVLLLVLRPLAARTRRSVARPERLRAASCRANAAQLLEELVAALLLSGSSSSSDSSPSSLPCFFCRRDREVRVVPVPLVHVGLRDLRPAERVPAVRVERAHAVRGDGQVAASQFRGGGAREGRDQDALRAVAVHRAPDLARQVGGLAGAGGPKIRYSDVTSWSRWPISSSVPVARCSVDGVMRRCLPRSAGTRRDRTR